jgi:hypothetical protein
VENKRSTNILADPIEITSPALTTHLETDSPFNSVPFLLFKSSRIARSLSFLMTAWRRDTEEHPGMSSEKHISAAVSLPIRIVSAEVLNFNDEPSPNVTIILVSK